MILATAVVMGGYVALLWWLRRRDIRWMHRLEADGEPVLASRVRMRVQGMGAAVIIGAVALPIPMALGGLGVPAPIPLLVGIPLGLLGVRAVNRLGRRRPELVLPHIRWPDELRTLATPAGRVLLGIGVIVAVVVPLAVIRGA